MHGRAVEKRAITGGYAMKLSCILAALALPASTGAEEPAPPQPAPNEPTSEPAPTGEGEPVNEPEPVPASPDDAEVMTPIIVTTGARTEERADATTVATEVLTREDLEATGAENVAEALEELSGLEIVPDVAGQVVRVRGLDAQQTLILVDGDRVIGRINGGIDLTRLSLEEVERIEIVRSGSSALYGSEASGGVIHIVTRRPARQRQLLLHMVGGFLGTRESHGFSGDASVTASMRRARGALVGTAGIHHMPAFRRDPGSIATANAEVREMNAEVRGELELAERHVLVARGRTMLRDLWAIDASATGATFDRRSRTEEHQLSLGTNHDFARRGDLELRATFSYFRDQYMNDQRGGPMDTLQDTREQMIELRARHAIAFSAMHRLVAGVDSLVERLDTPRLSQIGVRGRVSPFAEYRFVVGEDEGVKLTLVPGVRGDLDTQFGAFVSPKLAARLDVPHGFVFRGSIGRGFRAPSFRESYLSFENTAVGYRVVGNPDLGAETSLGLELGAEWRASSAVTMSGTGFRTQLDDMITTATDPTDPMGATYTYVNLARARHQGIETAASLRPWPWMRVDLGYVLLDARDMDTNRRIENRARHRVTGKLELRHARSGARFIVRSALTGKRQFYTPDGYLYFTAQWLSLDVRYEQPIGDHVDLFLGADNLVNAGGVNLPLRPRGVYLGVDLRL